MEKVAVIGEEGLISGFAALGADVYPVQSAEEATRALTGAAEKNYRIVYITESWAEKTGEAVRALSRRLYPVVVIIPGRGQGGGRERDRLRAAAEKAIGTGAFLK